MVLVNFFGNLKTAENQSKTDQKALKDRIRINLLVQVQSFLFNFKSVHGALRPSSRWKIDHQSHQTRIAYTLFPVPPFDLLSYSNGISMTIPVLLVL
jgi:hypothetical protein